MVARGRRQLVPRPPPGAGARRRAGRAPARRRARTCSSATAISTTRWGSPTCSPSARSTGWSTPGCSARPRSPRPWARSSPRRSAWSGPSTVTIWCPLSPGDRVAVGKGLAMEAFATDHVVPSLGYHLWRGRRRLAPAYAGLPPAELIAAARARGGDRPRSIEDIWLTYCGDTGPRIFEMEPRIFRSRVLMLECTFLGEEHRDKGEQFKHLHLGDIAAPGGELPATRPSSCITCRAGSESRICGPKSSGACRSWRPEFTSSWRERQHERTTERRRAGRRRTRPWRTRRPVRRTATPLGPAPRPAAGGRRHAGSGPAAEAPARPGSGRAPRAIRIAAARSDRAPAERPPQRRIAVRRVRPAEGTTGVRPVRPIRVRGGGMTAGPRVRPEKTVEGMTAARRVRRTGEGSRGPAPAGSAEGRSPSAGSARAEVMTGVRPVLAVPGDEAGTTAGLRVLRVEATTAARLIHPEKPREPWRR